MKRVSRNRGRVDALTGAQNDIDSKEVHLRCQLSTEIKFYSHLENILTQTKSKMPHILDPSTR